MANTTKKDRLILFILLFSFLTLIGISVTKSQALPSHGSIIIASNADFASHANITGSGTIGDPYVFENYVITSTGVSGIAISDTDAYFIIRNMEITGSTNSGVGAVHLDNVTHGYLTNNTVTNNFDGFRLVASSNNTLNNNVATSNTNDGFRLASSSNNNIFSNNNGSSNSNSGFNLITSSNNTFSNNTATGNSNFGFLLFSNGNNNNIFSNNTVTNNFSGFYVDIASNNNVLTNNIADSNTQYGFYLVSSNNNNLTNNIASNNTLYGFYIASDNNVLSNNTASNNTRFGFYLLGGIGNILSNNSATNNSDHGFRIFSSSTNTLSNNTATSNFGYGFHLFTSSNNNVLSNNSATSNFFDGFRLASSSSNALNNNTATNNTFSGFFLSSSSNNVLSNNIATSNSQDGFHLFGSSTNTLDNNIATSNTQHGFFVDSGSTGNTITSNLAMQNEENGFALEASNQASFGMNTAGYNTGADFNLPIDLNASYHLVADYGSPDRLIWDTTTYTSIFDVYTLYRDGSQLETGIWPDRVTYLSNAMTLQGLGDFNNSLVVTPGSGGVVSQRILVSLWLAEPVLTLIPVESSFEEGSLGNFFSWKATTTHPDFYELFQNGTLIANGIWDSNIAVILNGDDLKTGDYNFTIVFTTSVGTSITDTLVVQVTGTSSPQPAISTITETTTIPSVQTSLVTTTVTDASSNTSSRISETTPAASGFGIVLVVASFGVIILRRRKR